MTKTFPAHRVRAGEPRDGDGDEHLQREDTPQDGQALRRRHHHQHQCQEPSTNVMERLNKRMDMHSTFCTCIFKLLCTLYIPMKTLIIPLGCFKLKCTVHNSVAVASSGHNSYYSWEATSKPHHQYPQGSFLA